MIIYCAQDNGWQMAQAGGLGAADPVLDPGLGSVAGFEELGLAAGGAGGCDLVPLSLVLLEQGQLGAGARVPADQDPHVRRRFREPSPRRRNGAAARSARRPARRASVTRRLPGPGPMPPGQLRQRRGSARQVEPTEKWTWQPRRAFSAAM